MSSETPMHEIQFKTNKNKNYNWEYFKAQIKKLSEPKIKPSTVKEN